MRRPLLFLFKKVLKDRTSFLLFYLLNYIVSFLVLLEEYMAELQLERLAEYLDKLISNHQDIDLNPALKQAEKDILWVPDKIDGEKFEEGHRLFLIKKPAHWALPRKTESPTTNEEVEINE